MSRYCRAFVISAFYMASNKKTGISKFTLRSDEVEYNNIHN